MELLFPETWSLSFATITTSIGMIVLVVGSYWRLTFQINRLSEAFDDMKVRNQEADAETEQVKKKQSGLEMTVAVMAEQLAGMSKSQERVEACVTEIARELRNRAR